MMVLHRILTQGVQVRLVGGDPLEALSLVRHARHVLVLGVAPGCGWKGKYYIHRTAYFGYKAAILL